MKTLYYLCLLNLGIFKILKLINASFFSRKALTIHKKYILKPSLIGVFFRYLAKNIAKAPLRGVQFVVTFCFFQTARLRSRFN